VVGVAGRRPRGRAGGPCVVFRSVRPAGARPTARGNSCLPFIARFLEPAYPKTGPPALKAVIKELRRAAAGCRKAPSLTSLPRSPANGADDGLDLALDERRRRLAPELPDRGRMQPGGSVLTSERERATTPDALEPGFVVALLALECRLAPVTALDEEVLRMIERKSASAAVREVAKMVGRADVPRDSWRRSAARTWPPRAGGPWRRGGSQTARSRSGSCAPWQRPRARASPWSR